MPEARTYSYVRFSSPEQLKGDSLRRQVEATEAWCAKSGIPLDTSLTLRDLGKSAFRGAHRDDKAALGAFLRAINQGKVAAGSFLALENLDRLSREEEVPACHLLTSILMAGVKVVQLFPSEMILTEQSNGWELMRAVMELSRGHGESAMKSRRNGEAWEKRRRLVRDGKAILTHQLPGWIEEVGGVLCLIPNKAKAVRRAFALAAEGLGAGLIVKTLIREGHPTLGTSGLWSRAYVSLIVKDRRAVGEFQPRYRNGRPAGDPVPDYFPPCVTEAQWQAARLGMGGRKQPRGRVGEYVNLFAGLLFNAREGDHYYCATRTNKGKHRRVLIAQRACENGSPAFGFDFEVFEQAILSLLREVNPRQILGDAPGQDEVIILSGELEHVRTQQDAVAFELLKGDSKTLAKAARALDAREKELIEQLDEARRQASHPAGECWGEAMTLIDAMDAAPDPKEARLKLRGLFRQLVESLWILVVPLTATRRVAAVQVFFESGARRDYLIFCQGAGRGRAGGWWARSLADVADGGDLRDRKQAKELEKILTATDLETMSE
jgi:DNA invertase Pin-like site-specific DNA recombinase